MSTPKDIILHLHFGIRGYADAESGRELARKGGERIDRGKKNVNPLYKIQRAY